jgi:hypothetical protein
MGTARNLANFKPSSAGLAGVEDLDTSATQLFGMRNRIVNGAMMIDQRNAGALVSSANGFITDRWSLAKYDPTGGAYSGQQVTDAPSGFTNSLKVTVTTSITQSADQYWQLFQKIEGFNTADLGFGTSSASQVTVSFWIKSSVTGTYSVSLFNEGVGSTNRAYVTTYTINAANTWEYKTVTITGDGASGAGYWGTTNGSGLGVYFDLGCGTNQQATANTWTTSNARRVSGTVRLMATGSATWQVTGIQLEKGSTATSFDYRPYGTELALCQRYGQLVTQQQNSGDVCGTGSTTNVKFQFPVTMRSAPTASLITAGSWIVGNGYSANYTSSSASIVAQALSTQGGRVNIGGFSGFGSNFFVSGSDAVGTAVMFMSSEL